MKTCLASLERWGGAGNGAIKSASSSHTNEKKMAAIGAFSQTLIFFQYDFFTQHLGPDAYSAVRGQQFRAKNIKVTKNIFKIFLELQTFFVQYKGIVQCFFSP